MQHLIDAEAIWGINFFWAKDLKFSEKELKTVTKQAMCFDEPRNFKDEFEKKTGNLD